MSAYVVYPGRKATNVKNLGWLLSHWKEVQSFTVIPPSEGTMFPDGDAELIAVLSGGRTFHTVFASKTVLKEWLHRPVFRGVPLSWFGKATVA